MPTNIQFADNNLCELVSKYHLKEKPCQYTPADVKPVKRKSPYFDFKRFSHEDFNNVLCMRNSELDRMAILFYISIEDPEELETAYKTPLNTIQKIEKATVHNKLKSLSHQSYYTEKLAELTANGCIDQNMSMKELASHAKDNPGKGWIIRTGPSPNNMLVLRSYLGHWRIIKPMIGFLDVPFDSMDNNSFTEKLVSYLTEKKQMTTQIIELRLVEHSDEQQLPAVLDDIPMIDDDEDTPLMQ